MKTVQSAIELWHLEPKIRSVLTRYNILACEGEKITIPTFKCRIEKMGKSELREYPFYMQKFETALEFFEGDYHETLNNWNEQSRTFLCGKTGEITVSLV